MADNPPLDRTRFDWSLVRSFLAVVDAGSLTGAARRTGALQPTLSRHIAELEGQLGAPLFERTGRGVVPTAAALAIIEAARTVAATGKPVTRDAIRDALQNVKVKTVMGMVEFDANGDIKSKVVSVYQIKKDAAKGLDDPSAQYKYIGVAPEA